MININKSTFHVQMITKYYLTVLPLKERTSSVKFCFLLSTIDISHIICVCKSLTFQENVGKSIGNIVPNTCEANFWCKRKKKLLIQNNKRLKPTHAFPHDTNSWSRLGSIKYFANGKTDNYDNCIKKKCIQVRLYESTEYRTKYI